MLREKKKLCPACSAGLPQSSALLTAHRHSLQEPQAPSHSLAHGNTHTSSAHSYSAQEMNLYTQEPHPCFQHPVTQTSSPPHACLW